jgi:hypothetical protein
MSDDETPVYVFRIGGEFSSADFERFAKALDDARERTGLEGEFVLVNEHIEPVEKDELREMLNDE